MGMPATLLMGGEAGNASGRQGSLACGLAAGDLLNTIVYTSVSMQSWAAEVDLFSTYRVWHGRHMLLVMAAAMLPI